MQKSRARREWLEAFFGEYPVTLLLKGVRTLIGERGAPPAYNMTGHPGMATGGMGDVLAGVAAELSLRDSPATQESLTASDILTNLGLAFLSLPAYPLEGAAASPDPNFNLGESLAGEALDTTRLLLGTMGGRSRR